MPVTFNVAPVKVEPDRTKSATIMEASKVVQDLWEAEQTSKMPPNTKLKYEVGTVNHTKLVQCSAENAIIGTVFQAYATHMPLILSPDDFWLMIMLAVSQFLSQNENAENYRSKFVDHDEKMKLSVETGMEEHLNGKTHYWSSFVEKIVQQIKENTKTNVPDLMTSHFSTTGPVEAAVFQMSLMESMKHYIDNENVITLCGIPKITLEGELADYKSIIDRIDALIIIIPDFTWYLQRAKDHMKKVLVTFEGRPDIVWWNRMIIGPAETQRNVGCGEMFAEENMKVFLKKSDSELKERKLVKEDIGRLHGWISEFFPYTNWAGNEVPQKNLNTEEQFSEFNHPLVSLTPFDLIDAETQINHPMKLAGGFVGTAKKVVSKREVALRPAIGWFVYWLEDVLDEEEQVIELREKNAGNRKALLANSNGERFEDQSDFVKDSDMEEEKETCERKLINRMRNEMSCSIL